MLIKTCQRLQKVKLTLKPTSKTKKNIIKDHLPYISHAVARRRYEEPNNCNTDPGIEFGCAQKWKALELAPDAFSRDKTNEPIGFCKFLSHAVLKTPSVIIIELSVPNSLIK